MHVPFEYELIQTALDELENGDTVLVGVGIYAEALVAPPLSFLLAGDIYTDSLEHARPTINPSSLLGSDTLACLRLTGGSQIRIEEFIFKNDSRMYTPDRTRIGGIINSSTALTLLNCEFDSVYSAVRYGNDITLVNCNFHHVTSSCVRPLPNGKITATDCNFSSQAFYMLVCGSRSHFTRCHFRDNRIGHLLVASGDSVIIESCIFGPYGPYIFMSVSISPNRDCIIRNNLFTDCQLGPAILEVQMDCPNQNPMPIKIIGNTFQNYSGGAGQGGEAIYFGCQPGGPGYFGVVEDNVFEDGLCVGGASTNGIFISGSVDLNNNRFTRLNPDTVPRVYAWTTSDDEVDLQSNLFFDNGFALSRGSTQVDARMNWWGDSTGPYNPTSNPFGQGAQIGNGIQFTPWHTDTLFFNEAEEPRAPIPQEFNLSVFPNPFNSFAKIKLEVPDPMIVKVELFDLLGRRVKELYNAPVAYEKEISFTAENLSSGVYFVRAKDTIRNRPLATKKLLLMK